MARHGQGGRPSKGDRDQILTRPPRALGDAVRAHAEELGMTVSDYVATLLADAHGMPEYAPSRVASRPQEELPLKSA
ncbi:hypothetical protein GCM10028814_20430 [Angustibacter aerolatus]